MKGTSSTLMVCSVCGEDKPAQKTGVCHGCTLRAYRPAKKYHFTPELDAGLRRAYEAKNKTAATRQIDELVRRTRWPRHVFNNRAHRLGYRICRTPEWSRADLDTLRELAGEMTAAEIGKRLHRTGASVKQRLSKLGISGRVSRGYSRFEFAQQMGVYNAKVEQWIDRGWLKIDANDRITDASIERFLWEHMDEYRFKSCDEQWLKGMLNPRVGGLVAQHKAKRVVSMPEFALRRSA